jgi:hypothetical protein
MTLSPGFAHALNETICVQPLRAFDPEECTSAVPRIFLDYSTTVDRLTLAAVKTMRIA